MLVLSALLPQAGLEKVLAAVVIVSVGCKRTTNILAANKASPFSRSVSGQARSNASAAATFYERRWRGLAAAASNVANAGNSVAVIYIAVKSCGALLEIKNELCNGRSLVQQQQRGATPPPARRLGFAACLQTAAAVALMVRSPVASRPSRFRRRMGSSEVLEVAMGGPAKRPADRNKASGAPAYGPYLRIDTHLFHRNRYTCKVSEDAAAPSWAHCDSV